MTDKTITTEQIQATNAYQSLNPTQKTFCVKRDNRKTLTNALIIKMTTGIVPGNIFGYNEKILADLVKIVEEFKPE
jgi:hypothetical protein